MKTLKILFVIICVFCFTVSVQGQDEIGINKVNFLSISEWNAIKINGVSWRKVEYTRGDEAKIKKLFGNDMKKIGSVYSDYNEHDLDYFESKKKGLSLAFYFYGEKKIYYLESFSITNKNSNIKILGVTLTIGDSINKLKNVKINYEYNQILFPDGDAAALSIKFDPKTKKITEIEYTSVD